MRIQVASLSLLALALPSLAFADGGGSIKIGPASGESAPKERVRTGVSSANGQAQARPRRLKPGEVLFHLENADLSTVVLPLLEEQAGIKLGLQTKSRPVTLRLVQPIHWEAALDLVCRFANVHVTKDHAGKIVVRNSYGGELGSSENWNDIAGTLSAEAMSRLDERRRAAEVRRAANYKILKARHADLNKRSKFNGTSAVGGFGWRGGNVRANYSRGTYSRGQYARGNRQAARTARGTYSRGQYSRGQYSRGNRTRGMVQRGQYSRGQYSRGNRNIGNRNNQRGQYSRGQYSRGSRGGGGR
jgi:hypothetical protein